MQQTPYGALRDSLFLRFFTMFKALFLIHPHPSALRRPFYLSVRAGLKNETKLYFFRPVLNSQHERTVLDGRRTRQCVTDIIAPVTLMHQSEREKTPFFVGNLNKKTILYFFHQRQIRQVTFKNFFQLLANALYVTPPMRRRIKLF